MQYFKIVKIHDGYARARLAEGFCQKIKSNYDIDTLVRGEKPIPAIRTLVC